MKQAEDIKTCELAGVEVVQDAPKRGRGRPPASGVAMSAAERQKLRRERLKVWGVEPLTFLVSEEVAAALRKFVEFKDMTQAEAIDRILRDRLLRKR